MAPTTPSRNIPHIDRTVFAHRGLPSKAPENTLASFRSTAESGTQWIETDVDIIADGTPIIIHDSALDRTTDASGSFYPLVTKDLESIDAGSWYDPSFAGERIPTLHQLIDFVNEHKLNLNLEIKQNEQGKEQTLKLIDAVVAELDRLDPECQVIVSSFSQPTLIHFHQQAPYYATAVLYHTVDLYDDWVSVLEFCGASYVHPQNKGLTRERVEAFRAAGYGVNVWTVNDAERAKELFDWGCTGIFTDKCDEMIRLFGR